MGKVAKAGVWLDETARRIAMAVKGWLVWPCLYAVALAAGAWSFAHPDKLGAIDTNKLEQSLRVQALYWLLASAGAFVVIYFGAISVRRLLRGSWRDLETIAICNRVLRPVLAAPLLAHLRMRGLEKDSPKLTLFLAALTAAIVGVWIYQLGDRKEASTYRDLGTGAPSRWSRWGRWAAPVAVLMLWIAYGWFFSRLAIINHHALNTRTTDLGYYENIFYQSIHGKPLGCSWIKGGTHVSAHFDPALVVLSPLYLIRQRAETLLVLQSVWLGAGVVPVYLLARRLLESRASGVVLAAMYALYPALHGANMYEFHSLTLITPVVLWTLYFFETGATKRYFATFLFLLLFREDVALLMCFVGFYEIVSRRPGGGRIGLATIAISVVYFVIVKAVFMKSSGILNAGKEAYSFDYYYEAMNPGKLGAGGLLTTIVSNPVFTLKTMLDEPKVMYVLLLFLPLLLLPFFARPQRLMLLYGLVFTTLASRTAVFSIHFQYSSSMIPVAFAAVPSALRRVRDDQLPVLGPLRRRSLVRGLLGAAFVATLLVSWKFGGVIDNQSFKGGFLRVARSLSPEQSATYAWVDEKARSIPPTARVGATNKLGCHISNRKHASFWPDRTDVDYAFVDETEIKGAELEKHQKLVGTRFEEVSRRGKMVLLKRQ